MSVNVSRSQTPLDGTFSIEVTAAVDANIDEEPTTGSLEIVTDTETVAVAIVADGVEMSLDGAAAIAYTWQEYEDLLDDEQAATWQRRARSRW